MTEKTINCAECNVGDNNPEAIVGAKDATNAKGTTSGWKRVTGLNISITAANIYWIAVQVDSAPNTNTNYTDDAGEKADTIIVSTLPDPWGASTLENTRLMSIYAVYEAAAGTNMQINIGDAWKSVAAMKINIGDAWKDVASAKINIGDAWKTIF